MCLFYLNHSPHSWHWNVRFRPQEAVYTGNDTCHITITCNQSGFHLTRDGQRLFTERYIRNLNELLCIPCIIRRASLHAGGISRDVEYIFQSLAKVMNEIDRRDDLIALRIAITQKSTLKIGTWIAKSGPLPTAEFDNFKQVFKDGLDEVESYLLSENIV